MSSLSIRSFLALSAIVVTGLIPLAVSAEGYIGEDLGVDLYRRVDSGVASMRKTLVEKRIPGSAKRMNETIKSQCDKVKNTDVIETSNEFTASELSQISQGVSSPLYLHLKPQFKATGVATDLLECIQNVVGNDFANMQYESAKEQRTLEKLGSVGLYTDGNTDNSSFDLMYDLSRIHDILFSKDIPYNGKSNPTNGNLKAFLSNPTPFSSLTNGLTLSDRLSFDLADSGWQLVNPDKPQTT